MRPESDRSPLADEPVEFTGDVHRFGIEIDFDVRFAGFASHTLPPERPADAAVTRDTVAYWRFDRVGISRQAHASPRFDGEHAWMGILGREGRIGDAGKDGGRSPDDPPCSLAPSGERFVRFVVYPRNRDDDPTCWSRALPLPDEFTTTVDRR